MKPRAFDVDEAVRRLTSLPGIGRLDGSRSGAAQSRRGRRRVGRRLPPAEHGRIRVHRRPANLRRADAGTARALPTAPATRRPAG